MYAYLSSKVLSDEEEVKRKTVTEAQYFSLCDGVLYKWFHKIFKTEESEKYVKHMYLPVVLRHDALTSFHDTNAGYRYLFIMVDSFTKWVEAFIMKTQ